MAWQRRLANRPANWPILPRLQVFKKICRLRGLERWPYQKPCEVRRVVTSIAASYSRHDTFDRRLFEPITHKNTAPALAFRPQHPPGLSQQPCFAALQRAAAAANAAVEDTGSGVASPTPSRTPSAADRQLAASASQGGLDLLLSAATARDFALTGQPAGAGAQDGVSGPAGTGSAAVLPHQSVAELACHPELLQLAKVRPAIYLHKVLATGSLTMLCLAGTAFEQEEGLP